MPESSSVRISISMHVCKCEHGCEQGIPIMNGGAGILLRHHGKSLISCVSPGSKQGMVGSVVLAPSMPTCLRIPPVILCVGVVPKAWRWHGSHEPENAGKPIFPGVSPESKQGMVGGIAFFPASAIAPAAPRSTGCIRPPTCADRKCVPRVRALRAARPCRDG